MPSSHIYLDGSIWYGWYYDAQGVQRRRSTRCTDKRAALLVVREWERRAADPNSVAANEATIDSALTRLYADRQAKGRSPDTVEMYRKKGGHVVRLLGGNTPLDQVNAIAVDKYVVTRLAEGAERNTIGKELTTIRSMLKVARRRGEYLRDVAGVMPDGFSLEYKPKRTFLTREQLTRLLDALKPGRAARVAWIVATAARWGESDRARREDIDLGAGLGMVEMRGTKTEASAGKVPMISAAIRTLLERAIRDADGPPGGQMFLPWGNVRRDLHAACERAERDKRGSIPRVSPNDLRRTLATWMRQAGVAPHLIGSMLRHSDSRMAERVYGRMPVEDLAVTLQAQMGSDTGLINLGQNKQSKGPKRTARSKKTA